MSTDSSFEVFLTQLQVGDSSSSRELHERYVSDLVRLASQRISDKFQARIDPDDIVQSVFRSFFTRHARGEFRLEGWECIWSLLASITIRKCCRKATDMRAARRDVRREVIQPVNGWDFLSHDPTPDAIATMEDLLASVLEKLDERSQRIVLLKMQNFSNDEISEKVGRTERTVCRCLRKVRETLIRMHRQM